MDTTPEPEQLRPASETVEPEAQPTTTIAFEFTGTVREYFKIWIVNVGLTIATLGVYSAWAKVRRKRYLYGNTWLQGSSFEYLGDPMKILKGRLIVVGIVAAYSWATMSTAADLDPLGLLFITMLPLLVVTARTFNARNSSYRHIRFDFRARWGEAFMVFWVVPIFVGLTAGLIYPYFAYRRSEFLVGHSAFGLTPFVWLGQAWDKIKRFTGIYIIACLLAGVFFGLFLILLFGSAAAQGEIGRDSTGGIHFSVPPPLSWVVGSLLIFIAVAVVGYLKAKITNLVWSHTVVGHNRFASTLEPRQMMWLYASNAAAIWVSFGLLIPWAVIRTLCYRLDHFQLLAASDLDEFVASQQDKFSATGEEASEFFDVDVGI